MIEGLKSQVKGDELKRLVSLHMTHLKNQHERLSKKLEAMRAAAKEVDKELAEIVEMCARMARSPG